MSAPSEPATIVPLLKAALRRRMGSAIEVEDVEIATLGGSNRTLLFDCVDGEARRRLVLRQETLQFARSPFLPPHTQYVLLEVAYRGGVPVPEPIFELAPEDELGRGYVVACVRGETLPKRLLSDAEFAPARARLVGQAGHILATLHRIDTAEVAILEAVEDSVDALAAQRAHYDFYGEPHPVLDYALRWLERQRPPLRAKVFLHGDFRIGNMLVDPKDGIRALLDWECAHLGAPEEDLAWFCMRAWRFGNIARPAGGCGSRAELFAAYAAAGGAVVDPAAVRWWEIYGLVRWALYNIMQVYGHVSGQRRSPAFAACGRNTAMIEYDLLLTLAGRYD